MANVLKFPRFRTQCDQTNTGERQIPNQSMNIQQIVQAVTNNLNTLPTVPPTTSINNGVSSNRFGSQEEELRRIYSLPRGSGEAECSTTNSVVPCSSRAVPSVQGHRLHL